MTFDFPAAHDPPFSLSLSLERQPGRWPLCSRRRTLPSLYFSLSISIEGDSGLSISSLNSAALGRRWNGWIGGDRRWRVAELLAEEGRHGSPRFLPPPGGRWRLQFRVRLRLEQFLWPPASHWDRRGAAEGQAGWRGRFRVGQASEAPEGRDRETERLAPSVFSPPPSILFSVGFGSGDCRSVLIIHCLRCDLCLGFRMWRCRWGIKPDLAVVHKIESDSFCLERIIQT